MSFASILYPPASVPAPAPAPATSTIGEPECFVDLRLDRVVAAITAGCDEYDLAPIFWAPLPCLEAVRYRQQVFTDLGDARVLDAVRAFTGAMQSMRQQRDQAATNHEPGHAQAWFLCAAESYCSGVRALTEALGALPVASQGLLDLRGFVDGYVAGPTFTTLAGDAAAVRSALQAVRYAVHVRGLTVRVSAYEGEDDYGATVASLFERFAGAGTDRQDGSATPVPWMDHVEASVLQRVARLFPEPFGALDAFCARWAELADPVLVTFEREVQFYVAVLDHMRPMVAAGLGVCLPEVVEDPVEVAVFGTYDVALAHERVAEDQPVVTNDVVLRPGERLLVVTGPNQGGKTTFGRAVGQLYHLASLGCPVAARQATVGLADRVRTHFIRQEDLVRQRGGLADDLARIHAILEALTTRSVVVINELFSSTTAEDAAVLGGAVIRRLLDAGVVGVYITFLDELASVADGVVSMVAEIDASDVSVRTFRMARHPADGLAYAVALAEHHGLTAERLHQRLAAR